MSRRRRSRWQGESFGASLADILMTALGCVLLLFLVAVMQIRDSLRIEKKAHGATQARLIAEEEGRIIAEQDREFELGKRRAIETALSDAQSARGQANNALTSALDQLAATQRALAEANARAEAANIRYAQLRSAAQTAVTELDPRTANPVDVMLVIDGTRSMQPSLDATRANLNSTIEALRVVSPTARIGVVVFRDKREKKRLRLQTHPLTENVASLSRFLKRIEATSTKVDDDLPEWICGGIAQATKANWRRDAIRLVIVVSDAGSQVEGAEPCITSATDFHAQGGRVYTLSTLPSGYKHKAHVTQNYDKVVLPEHAAIAMAGGGKHVRATQEGALLTEVLRAAFTSRTETPLDTLRDAVQPVDLGD